MKSFQYNRLNQPIDGETTINSGQVFLWEKLGEKWYGVNGSDVLIVQNNPFKVTSFFDKSWDFFREKDDIEKIIRKISKDKIIKKAIQSYPGLRLLRQDPFQCYISFITSSNSNIPRIKLVLQNICKKFGKKIRIANYDFYLFPKPEKLANATLQELQGCGLGYRSKAIKEASKVVIDGKIDFTILINQNYYQVKEKLLNVFGIGNKVADCIMLFSLEKLEAFPIDRWMLRILQKYYPKKNFSELTSLTEKKYQSLHEEIVDYFGPYAGYSQQFLFKMERDQNKKKWL